MTENKQKYHKYLLSDSWAAKRKKVTALRKGKCEKCGSMKSLHVHHLHYKNIFHEEMEDLQLLCKKCHYKVHKRFVPKKNNHKKRSRKTKGTRKEVISIDLLVTAVNLQGYKAAAKLLRAARGIFGPIDERKAKPYVKKYIKRRTKKSRSVLGARVAKPVFVQKTILRKKKV